MYYHNVFVNSRQPAGSDVDCPVCYPLESEGDTDHHQASSKPRPQSTAIQQKKW